MTLYVDSVHCMLVWGKQGVEGDRSAHRRVMFSHHTQIETELLAR